VGVGSWWGASSARECRRSCGPGGHSTTLPSPAKIQLAVAELLRVAEARESVVGGVDGFAPAPSEGEARRPVEGEESLAEVLAEFEVGETLIAAGSVAGEGGAQLEALSLSDALESLEEATRRIHEAGEPATAGFWGRQEPPAEPPLELFRAQLPRSIDGIVTRTGEISKDVVTGLTAIPVSMIQPTVLDLMTASIPDTGPLVKAGLRAVRRAVQALQRLVPAEVTEKLREWATQWWDRRGDALIDRLARTMLSVEGLEAAARAALARPGLVDDRLRAGYDRLAELDACYARASGLIATIVSVLRRIVGPLAGLFGAVAVWLYGIGALGYLLALGAAVWVGRDHLDTGALVEVVPGVRAILDEATA